MLYKYVFGGDTSGDTYFSLETPLIVEPDPLVIPVGEGHLLLVVPDQRGVVHVEEVAHLVVGHEARLVGILARGSCDRCEINT